MIVLSLFDGMSCGQIALNRAGIKYKKYYASEIDKHAISVTQKNYPETIQLGSIEDWKGWEIEKPDLIIGGSPCQGFSFAGKQLNFKDPRSRLFFTFVDVLRHYEPKYFLLENVKMKREHEDVITKILNVEPVEINSALVSAQNRKRLYWSNIYGIKQPENRNILLGDILETQDVGCIKNRGEIILKDEKSQCLDANYFKGVDNHGQRTVIFKKNYAQWDISGKGHGSQDQGAYYENGKHAALANARAETKTKVITRDSIRKLTPIECERLQTVPDNYTDCVSKTQRYKMLGNGWTVDVIAHIFKFMKSGKVKTRKPTKQLTLF
jgi:DNA-cytosine methyltransferase